MSIISTLSISTRETPDTALSPTVETIIVSAIPRDIARNCSIMSGIKRLFNALFENIGYSV